ncbi:MAG: hypothetical protein KC619_00350 [Myxococcales bacterium]|nr:hypothetical protein [Myxococcales bacterium]
MGSVLFVVLLVGSGCGPSLRRVQDSRVYFERCYAADFDARIALAEKHACWTAWLEHYTGGQPPERASYARERLDAIEHGESVPRLPGLPEAAIGPRSVAPVTASSEQTEDSGDGPANVDEEELPRPRPRRQRYASPVPRTSNASCAANACEEEWRDCTDRCPDDREACETACEVELQACARGCF